MGASQVSRCKDKTTSNSRAGQLAVDIQPLVVSIGHFLIASTIPLFKERNFTRATNILFNCVECFK